MFTASKVRLHIDSLGDKQIITTRDLLYCGRRNAVDLALFKLVRKGVLWRLARGVFIRRTGDQYVPSVLKIARAKASAFLKKLKPHGNKAGKLFDFPQTNKSENGVYEYYCSGSSSSSFRCIYGLIKLHSVSARKMYLKNNRVGNLLKAMWFLGFRNRIVSRVKFRFHEGQLARRMRLEFRDEIKQVPSWIYDTFYPTSWKSKIYLKEFLIAFSQERKFL